MLYVRVSCFVVCGCVASMRYINVCNCDMLSIVNVYLNQLTLCVVCIDGRRYVCCSECTDVSYECDEQFIGTHGGVKLCTLGTFALGESLVS